MRCWRRLGTTRSAICRLIDEDEDWPVLGRNRGTSSRLAVLVAEAADQAEEGGTSVLPASGPGRRGCPGPGAGQLLGTRPGRRVLGQATLAEVGGLVG